MRMGIYCWPSALKFPQIGNFFVGTVRIDEMTPILMCSSNISPCRNVDAKNFVGDSSEELLIKKLKRPSHRMFWCIRFMLFQACLRDHDHYQITMISFDRRLSLL